jgi:ribosome-associated toxin RatA of RatAB toxin-antitoxin module
MREISRTALVPYAPAQMYALVADFEHYPQFLPWVSGAHVLERGPDYVVGRLDMHRSGLRESFTTRVTLRPHEQIDLDLVSGPFKTLHGQWTFAGIQDRGTKVTLHMRFEFSNALLNMLLGKTFEKNCGELVDAFVKRARALYDRK